jgi:oxygen-independent coproporphyrinogen-3 oxidase
MDEENDRYCCQHNLQYWLNEPYLGIGAGAHGYSNGLRTENVREIPVYIRRCSQGSAGEFPIGPAVQQTSAINPFMEMQETMMMGMRLIDTGVSKKWFFNRFNVDVQSVFGTELKYLEGLRLIEYAGENNETIRLTRKGYLLGNQVFMQFVG